MDELVERQKGGDGVEQQKPSKVARVFLTVLIWLGLALAAAAVAVLVQLLPLCFRAGFNGCGKAIRDGFPGAADPVSWARSLLNLVILLVSLAVAVRIMYPPKDLDDVPKPAGLPPAAPEDAAADYRIR